MLFSSTLTWPFSFFISTSHAIIISVTKERLLSPFMSFVSFNDDGIVHVLGREEKRREEKRGGERKGGRVGKVEILYAKLRKWGRPVGRSVGPRMDCIQKHMQ